MRKYSVERHPRGNCYVVLSSRAVGAPSFPPSDTRATFLLPFALVTLLLPPPPPNRTIFSTDPPTPPPDPWETVSSYIDVGLTESNEGARADRASRGFAGVGRGVER